MHATRRTTIDELTIHIQREVAAIPRRVMYEKEPCTTSGPYDFRNAYEWQPVYRH